MTIVRQCWRMLAWHVHSLVRCYFDELDEIKWKVFKIHRLYFRLIKSAIHLHSKSRRLPLLLSGAIWENQSLSQMFIHQCNASVWVCSLTFRKCLQRNENENTSFYSPETWSHVMGGLHFSVMLIQCLLLCSCIFMWD